MAPEDFTVTTMRDRFARHGDVWSDFYNRAPAKLDLALEMFERDVRDLGTGKYGGAEMPYPPDYPKMPGEPARVQAEPNDPDDKGKRGFGLSAG